MKQKLLKCLGKAIPMLVFTMLLSTAALAQQVISGKVTGPDGNPLSGATIVVKGTNIATSSAPDGTYTLQLPANATAIVFSNVGYDSYEMPVAGRTDFNFAMKTAASSLNEVVVTGYTSQRKKDITGSVAVVNVNTMKSIPSGTTESLLQGQAAGVTVINSGVPGGGSNVRIRGITSIGSTNPLTIIDGTPGNMHDLNVNDIESIQVLKDAGAAAIYGVRGSNGVVVITTKKGKQGKAKVTYDGYYGTQQPNPDGFRMANSQETANATQQSYINSGLTPGHKQFGTGTTPVIPKYITPTASATADPDTYALYTNQITEANQTGTDWFHEIFKPASIQSHTVSVSQASDRSNFYFSLGYFNQEGTLIETYLKRYSARINTVFNIKNTIRIGENAYVFYKQNPGFNNQNEGNAISHSYRESPLIPVYDIMGNFAGTGSQGFGNPQNPVANMKRTANNKGNNYQALGNVFAEVDLFKHFTARTTFGGTMDNYNWTNFSYTAYENAENNANANSFQENYGYNTSWTWTNTLNYTNNFGDHSIKALIGSEAINNAGRAIQGSRSSYMITDPGSLTVDPDLWTLDFGPPSGQSTDNLDGNPYDNSLYSLFGRIDYNFQDRFYVSGTLRRDGSSVFAPENRYGVFPSLSGGWRISRENFMKNATWLSDLKIRGGWGVLGSISNIGATNAFNLYNQTAANSYYDIGGTNNSATLGIYASQIGNTNTTWEEDVITNIGFDGSFFKNKFDVTFDWYKKSINGLLFQPASDITVVGGANPAFVNAGNIENTGLDFSLTWHGLALNNELKFDITGNFTTYDNKVISLPEGIKYYDQGSAGSGRLGAFSRMQPGQALGAFFGYQQLGLFRDAEDVAKSPVQPDAAPGRMKFADVNGVDANGNLTGTPDGKIDVNDRTFFGNPNPKLTYGLNLAVTFKGFDFGAFFYSSVGNDVINYIRFWKDFPQVWDAGIGKEAATDSWTPQNLDAKVPRLERAASFSTTSNFSSYYMEDGSFFRCKSLILGYTIPAASLKRVGIERLRIYFQALNLFTITNYTGIDPELSGSDLNNNTNFGIDFGNYPANQKGFNFGVNLGF